MIHVVAENETDVEIKGKLSSSLRAADAKARKQSMVAPRDFWFIRQAY